MVSLVKLSTDSTLKARMSFAAMLVVQPVKVESVYLLLEEMVGLELPQMLSATVGGKLAKVSFQIFRTTDPVWSASKVTDVMVAANGTCTKPLRPLEKADPPPSTTSDTAPV